MSLATYDYQRFVKTAKRMLKKFGTTTKIIMPKIVSNPDQPWEEGSVSNVEFDNLQCAFFEETKKFEKKGAIVTSTQTVYMSTDNTQGFEEIPDDSILIRGVEPNKRWKVIASEIIKPAETKILYIIWVAKYA